MDSDEEPTINSTRVALRQHNFSVPGLVVLCQGLKDSEGKDFINIDEDPWKTMAREIVKPKASMFRYEVVRRHDVFSLNGPTPRTKNWKIEKCQQWLNENPITAPHEIQYLQSKIQEQFLAQQQANAAKKLEMEALDKNWVGKYPYLRLIHCIVDDESIKLAFLKRNDIDNSRIALDNRNSDIKDPSVYDMIADLWNDSNFAPETETFPDLHPDFTSSETLTHALVSSMANATPLLCSCPLKNQILEYLVQECHRYHLHHHLHHR